VLPSRVRARRFAIALALVSCAGAAAVRAHDIPATVTLLAFLRPEGSRVRLLVRAPLEAMRDIRFPTRGPGYLDIPAADSALHDAARMWIAQYVELYEDGTRLGEPRIAAVRASLPSDRSFTSYDSALALVTGPSLPAATELVWQQAMLDVLLEYPVTSARSRFSIRPALAHLGLRTTTVLRFVPEGGAERAFQYSGDPGLVRLDPRWHQAAASFTRLGFRHILEGLDHLLFLFCLIIPFRTLKPLVAIVTAFTVAHSITLIASAAGYVPGALWFPPLIETLIAASIVYMAFENILGARLQRRWIVTFAFGLVHGFGFSFLLRESLQFAGPHLVTSLLAFNVGVELGQLAVLLFLLPLLHLFFRYAAPERAGGIILSALIAHTAWHWLTERGGELRQFAFEWPAPDLPLVAALMRGGMVMVVLAAALWGLYAVFGRLKDPSPT
jgi:hypothetical protein